MCVALAPMLHKCSEAAARMNAAFGSDQRARNGAETRAATAEQALALAHSHSERCFVSASRALYLGWHLSLC